MPTPEGITYIYAWHSTGDACHQCQQLNGRTWTDQDIYQNTLWDSIWGDIWDFNIDMPLTHGGTGANCCCQLEVRVIFDWEKITMFKELQKAQTEYAIVAQKEISNLESTSQPSQGIGPVSDMSSVTELKQEIDSLQSKIDSVKFSSEDTQLSLRQQTRMINEITMILERMTGSTDIAKAKQGISELIMVLMRLRMAILAVEEAAGPIGWLHAAINIGAFGLTASDIILS
jgi:hypothetical protein